jgi:phytoene dehydrogenase-like protein
MAEKVLIIGAGISGLSAGCYLQMNGFETAIYEMHSLPGGLCTSWVKDGYKIDGCIHWLVGTKPGTGFYNLWNELIDMKSLIITDHEIFFRCEDSAGNFINFYNNIDQLENELLAKAPEDIAVINDYIHAVRKFSRMNLPVPKPRELYTLRDAFSSLRIMGPYLPAIKKWTNVSIADFASRCKNPLLRKTIENLFVPEMSIVFAMITTAWMNNKDAGYPIGGSLEFAKKIEETYLRSGGQIYYRNKVDKIIVESVNGKSKASGIITSEGKVEKADYIISAADGNFTLNELLEGKFTDQKTSKFYKKSLPFSSYLQLSLGVDRKLISEVPSLIIPLSKPVYIDPSNTINEIKIRIHNFDPTLAPDGKTLISAMILTREDEYWTNLRTDNFEGYKKEKKRIISEVIAGAEHRLGPLQSHLEMSDLSTPATVIRYTNNWKGSFEGWVITPETGLKQLPVTLPDLNNFYMTGQWVAPGGGLPTVMMSARGVSQIICKKSKKKFITS